MSNSPTRPRTHPRTRSAFACRATAQTLSADRLPLIIYAQQVGSPACVLWFGSCLRISPHAHTVMQQISVPSCCYTGLVSFPRSACQGFRHPRMYILHNPNQAPLATQVRYADLLSSLCPSSQPSAFPPSSSVLSSTPHGLHTHPHSWLQPGPKTMALYEKGIGSFCHLPPTVLTLMSPSDPESMPPDGFNGTTFQSSSYFRFRFPFFPDLVSYEYHNTVEVLSLLWNVSSPDGAWLWATTVYSVGHINHPSSSGFGP